MSDKPTDSVETSTATIAVVEQEPKKEEVNTSNLKDVQTDDQPGEDTYKRGQNAKWTKARKADTDGRQTKKQKNAKECAEKRQWVPREPREALLDEAGNPIARQPKKKVAVMIGYCGTGYHGMQVNPPSKTIEGDLFDAFIKAGAISKYNADDPKKVSFMRAARTDKGVHAAGNLISLKLIIEDEDLIKKINDNLPEQIRVWGIERTNKAFDCRKMCGSRVYEYLIPTYSFVGPKPKSALGLKIKEQAELHPGITRDDQETVDFWQSFEDKVKEAGFTEEEITQIKEFRPVPRDEFDETDPIIQLIRKYKAIENDLKRSYRLSETKLNLMRDAMNVYIGHHNFHNFTLGKDFKDASASRYMKNITVSDPFVIDNTEWCSIKIHGQSFMLHQIRKMIAMATLVARTGCPLDRIKEAFNAEKVNIPKAPALGLLLEQPVYDGYNKRLQDFGYKEIDFQNYSKEMDAFKRKHIYDKIYAEEVKENVFNAFFNFIDTFSGDSIFDFLTAKGITKLSKDQIGEVQIPNQKEEGTPVQE